MFTRFVMFSIFPLFVHYSPQLALLSILLGTQFVKFPVNVLAWVKSFHGSAAGAFTDIGGGAGSLNDRTITFPLALTPTSFFPSKSNRIAAIWNMFCFKSHPLISMGSFSTSDVIPPRLSARSGTRQSFPFLSRSAMMLPCGAMAPA